MSGLRTTAPTAVLQNSRRTVVAMTNDKPEPGVVTDPTEEQPDTTSGGSADEPATKEK